MCTRRWLAATACRLPPPLPAQATHRLSLRNPHTSGFLGALQHIIGGYDSGVTGGVFAFKPFLNKFYPGGWEEALRHIITLPSFLAAPLPRCPAAPLPRCPAAPRTAPLSRCPAVPLPCCRGDP
jgi:hypothetical protein